MNKLTGSSADYSSPGLLTGGGVKRWLKEEIPLEDRKKMLTYRSNSGGTPLSQKYFIIYCDDRGAIKNILTDSLYSSNVWYIQDVAVFPPELLR